MMEKVRIEDVQRDIMDGSTTVFLTDGRAVKFDYHSTLCGELENWLDSMRMLDSGEPVDVMQYGRKVGELPAFWHPGLAKSKSFLYDYRSGDLKLVDGRWVASNTLGSSDLDYLVGFVRK